MGSRSRAMPRRRPTDATSSSRTPAAPRARRSASCRAAWGRRCRSAARDLPRRPRVRDERRRRNVARLRRTDRAPAAHDACPGRLLQRAVRGRSRDHAVAQRRHPVRARHGRQRARARARRRVVARRLPRARLTCDDPPMRIIAGSRKGHTIHAPRGRDTRPTSDRVRENVFNILGPVDGAAVLDLYAGSGAMGLEALSRGATRAVFVERDADAVRAIERNLDKLRLSGTVLRQDAVTALATEAGAPREYDLVVVVPPYDTYADIQPKLARYLPSVLADDAVVVVETDVRIEPELPLAQRTSRKYGSARITVYGASE